MLVTVLVVMDTKRQMSLKGEHTFIYLLLMTLRKWPLYNHFRNHDDYIYNIYIIFYKFHHHHHDVEIIVDVATFSSGDNATHCKKQATTVLTYNNVENVWW